MNRGKIFLSYRRDDVPGYVARLEDALEQGFGADSVFRDVEDIRGGSDWREVIDRTLRASAAVVLVIGRRWEAIWRERADDPVNYVELELERARELGVPVVPVMIEGATLSRDLDLGRVAWIRDRQFHEISDRQGRWEHDVARLVRILGDLDGLEPARDVAGDGQQRAPAASSGFGRLAIPAIALVALSLGGWWLWGGGSGGEPVPARPVQDSGSKEVSGPIMIADASTGNRRKLEIARAPAAIKSPSVVVVASSASRGSSLAGRWINRAKGLDMTITPLGGDRLRVAVAGKGVGAGELIPEMPGKFRFRLPDVGRGEFSLSNDGETVIGWFLAEKSGRKIYGRLKKAAR